MYSLITAFLASFVATILIIRFGHLHQKFSSDWDLTGPQKIHTSAVPRIGGIGIVIGLFLAIIINAVNSELDVFKFVFLICAMPTFAIGLTEDLTKKISPRFRLVITAFSAACFVFLFEAEITNLDIPMIDLLFAIPFFGIALSIFAITGLANAYNIIDGFNGLASMVGVMTLLALGYIAFTLDDSSVVYLSLIMASAILGFFVWNFPKGLIFLGDGGAYLIGFWIGSLTVWLCYRHPEISPWFALLVNGYPIMETLFSIYRRRIHQNKNPGAPDGIHFHTLIYRRVLSARKHENAFSANSRTAPYLWVLAGLSIFPAMFWWNSTPVLVCANFLFGISYILIYRNIVKFRTPLWMRL